MTTELVLTTLYSSGLPLSSQDIAHKLDEEPSVISKVLYKLRVERGLIERSENLKQYRLTNDGKRLVIEQYITAESPVENLQEEHVVVAEIEDKQPEKEEEMPETKEIDTSGFSSVELAELHKELISIEAKICSEVEDQDVKEIVLNSLIESTGGKVAEILESIRDNDVLR